MSLAPEPIHAPAPTIAAPLRPWGMTATTAWSLLAAAASMATGALAIGLLFADEVTNADLSKDARLFGWLSLAALVGEIAVLALACKLAGWRIADYLALALPSKREALIGVAATAALVGLLDVGTWLLGRDVITPFQVDIYRSARESGAWLPPLLAIVVAAPLGEELMFRGFLFRGWARSERLAVVTIIATSLLWAALHTQYDWFGIGQIAIIGLLFGWIRWRSGSTLLTILLHAAVNAWATVQTIVALEFLRAA